MSWSLSRLLARSSWIFLLAGNGRRRVRARGHHELDCLFLFSLPFTREGPVERNGYPHDIKAICWTLPRVWDARFPLAVILLPSRADAIMKRKDQTPTWLSAWAGGYHSMREAGAWARQRSPHGVGRLARRIESG